MSRHWPTDNNNIQRVFSKRLKKILKREKELDFYCCHKQYLLYSVPVRGGFVACYLRLYSHFYGSATMRRTAAKVDMQRWEQSTFTKGKYSNSIYLIWSVFVLFFWVCRILEIRGLHRLRIHHFSGDIHTAAKVAKIFYCLFFYRFFYDSLSSFVHLHHFCIWRWFHLNYDAKNHSKKSKLSIKSCSVNVV